MNKKFISALLFGAMTIASTSTFVSCSYDDEITELRGDIAELATDLSSLIDQKMKSVDAEIAALRSQAEALDAAYKAADAALEKTIAAATNDAKGYADIQAAQAQAAAIAAAQELVEDAQAELEAALAAANNTISEQGKTINGLLEADKTLTSAVTAAQARADQAYTLAEQANKLATENAAAIKDVAADLAAAQKSLGEAIEGLKATIAALDAQVKVLGEKVTALEAAAQKNAADIAAQAKTIEELKASNAKALEAAVSAAKSELLAEIEANAEEIEALEAEVAAAKAAAAAAVETAKAYTDAEVAKAKAEAIAASEAAAAAAADAQAAADEAQETADAALAAAAKAAEDAAKAIEAAQKASQAEAATAQATADKAVADAAAAAKAAADAQKAASDAQSAAIKAATDADAALEKKFNASLDAVKEAYAAADAALAKDIKAINESIVKINGAIDTVKKDLNETNANLVYESKRLKSLVFAPAEYVDGIECIRFATLQYRAWTSLEANSAPTVLANNVPNPLIHIDDASKTLEYLVNPKNVIKNDITKLSFISNTATNTRAVSQSAPIEVKDFAINNGVMAVKISKTGTGSFGENRDAFTIVSLKATLSDKFLTEEEVKNGEKAEVFSDWARLYETSVTPYIHNVLTNNANGSYNEGHANSHFWNFTTAYDGKPSSANLPHALNDQHIAKQVVYNQPIDLMTLVGVCDKDGKSYNAASYGLEFEFNLMTYKLLNNGSTTDATDQKKFAKLEGTTLTSTAANGEANNRDAIGRQPMIQVVLKDKANNKVVDVRYFKIKWVANAPAAPAVNDFGMFGNFTSNYICGDDYTLRVLEKTVNDLYAFVGESGLSRDEFHNAYELCTDLFTSLDEIKKETPTKNARLGTIAEKASGTGTGATYNYTWSVNTNDQKMTQSEYEAGKKVVTAYGYFYSKTDSRDRIAFSLKLTMNQKKIALKSGTGRDATMWKDGARYMNPALESDAAYGNTVYSTTQILGSLLQGYIRNGQTPVDVMDMININPDKAKFIFDIANTKGSWYVSQDGLTLYYDINNNFNVNVPSYDASEIAATIDEVTGKIQLKESNPGALDSEPTAAAKLLVGGKAPVKLYTEWCALTQILEKHDVNFLTPLEVSSQNIPVTLYDITAGGDSKATFAGKFVIKEKFTTNKRVVWSNKVNKTAAELALESVLVPWYGVKDPVFSTANAKTNIQPNGSIGATCNTPLANLKNSDGTPKYTVSISGDEVIFNNKSGNAIGQSFKIEIPVTVATKWQDVIEAKVVVTIMPAI